jgi:HK97 family phage prohead protease
MRDGAVDGLSIGFRVERARAERPTGLRRLERLDLWEISVVTFPMLPGARVETVKRAAPKLATHIRSAAARLFS